MAQVWVVTAPNGRDYEIETDEGEQAALAEFERQWNSGEIQKQDRREVVAEARGAPWYEKIGTSLGDDVRLGLSGLTGGWLEKGEAGLDTMVGNIGSAIGTREDVDYEDALRNRRQMTDDSRTRVSSTYNEDPMSGEHNAGAAFSEHVVPLMVAPQLMSKNLPAMMAEGGLYGLAQGTGGDEWTGRDALLSTLVGAGTGGLGNLATKGITKFIGNAPKPVSPKTGKAAERFRDTELAAAEGRSGMANLRAKQKEITDIEKMQGVQPSKRSYPHKEQLLTQELSSGPRVAKEMTKGAADFLQGGGGGLGKSMAGWWNAGLMPGIGGLVRGGANSMSDFPRGKVDELLRTISGQPGTDEAKKELARDMLSRFFMAGSKAGTGGYFGE